MGCLQSGKMNSVKPKISVSRGKDQQGFNELKTNYVLNPRTKVIGVNKYGRIF